MNGVPSIDLCVGGVLGEWLALRDYSDGHVKRVISRDRTVACFGSMRDVFTRINFDLNDDMGPSADVAVLVHYPVLLKQATISRYKKVYNCHPALLPFGRGYYPVPWAIIDGTPAGATIHEITDERIDAGPAVYQEQVFYSERDTAASLHERVTKTEQKLLELLFEHLSTGTFPEHLRDSPHMVGSYYKGTYHSKAEFEEARNMGDGWQCLSADTLLKYIRAFTFPPYPGLVVRIGGQDMELKANLR